jgi:VanZ family protein
VTILDWLQHGPRAYRWGLALVWTALIFFLSAQPDLPRPDSDWLDFLISSGAHLFLYGVLALLLGWALGDGARGLIVAFGLALLYGILDEVHQAFVPGRCPDALDLMWDGLGAALALVGWLVLRRALAHRR